MIIENLLRGHRVLFINSIRTDVPSGGNTATQNFIRNIQDICLLKMLSMSPSVFLFDKPIPRWLYILFSVPAPIFVLFARRTGVVWFEFFLRVSPIYFLICVWMRLRFRPDYVIFNHHASFLYSLVFLGCKNIYIWHDVPCLKHDDLYIDGIAARRCAGLERCLLKNSDFNFTFSFSDQKLLRRLHKRHAFVVPVVSDEIRNRCSDIASRRLLLIGNWNRVENTEGASALLHAYADQFSLLSGDMPSINFHVAGHGSVEYVRSLKKLIPNIKLLNIYTTEFYNDMSDFKEAALLAPLLRGAGIKLKTIEAWSRGIPVIGTEQAFSGIPYSIWKLGGILVNSPECMARLCHDIDSLDLAYARLTPFDAFRQYQDKIIYGSKND